jgi:RimJ/RimL family protein N-acetyltransferase
MEQKNSLVLQSSECEIRLRAISESDGEDLRAWKNAHRSAFFFQGIILPQNQKQWYQAYLTRPDDRMFMVVRHGESIGCLGFRMIENQADIYNVIRGRSEPVGKGLMSQALRLMCSFILAEYSRDLRAKVLLTNPALDWYRKFGFRTLDVHDRYVEIGLDLDAFRPWPFEKTTAVG